ncbi:MAG: IS30 family transposase [Clostridia bacterium]|nr:IS30 family transposase [Clostridia bacterium]
MGRKRIVCPKCGGRLYRDALIQYANQSRINLDGSISTATRRVEIGSEEAEIIYCGDCGTVLKDAYTDVVDGKEMLVWNDASYIEKGVFLRVTNKNLPRRGEKKGKYQRVRPARAPRGESIEKRPDEINHRSTFGHWEGDTIVGKRGSKRTLLCFTERMTRKEIIIRLPDKTAASVVKAMDRLERKYGGLFPKVFKTITFDNGSEFADCEGIERSAIRKGEKRTKVYYCHPYSAYERGSNENQNGIIRRPFPKGTSFDKVTLSQVAAVEDWINDYPRALFGYKSANDMFAECLCSI